LKDIRRDSSIVVFQLDGILMVRQRESEKNYRRNSEERFRSQ